jgi:hypothetical protein
MFRRCLSPGWLLPVLLAASAPAGAEAQDRTPFATAPVADLATHAPVADALGSPGPGCSPDTGRLPFDDPPVDREFRMVWGIAGAGNYYGQRMAPNGFLYHTLFMVDIDFNIWLWPAHGLYLFDDTQFWMQTTHNSLNFTKRELDLDLGVAWNYYGRLEARMFGYAQNNLNRGFSPQSPSGYNDGLGLENRYYLSPVYDVLGTSDFDQAKATFVSLGYFPTKTFTGADGQQFLPSLFARAYLTWDVFKECCYLYADTLFIARREPFNAKLLDTDVGLAVRPFHHVPRFEFRAGCLDVWDMQVGNARPVGYFSMRYIF